MSGDQGTEPYELTEAGRAAAQALRELARADAAAVPVDDLDGEVHFTGPEAAAQRLAELTEKLGLYHEMANCAFCGALMPCAAHRAGG